jgi:acylphosphatase
MQCSKKSMAVTAKHLLIHGRVQGVGYRAWMSANARQLGLNGWVRNRADGTVEAAIAGNTATIEAMIAACHDGPLAARVTQVEVADWAEEIAQGFTSRPTA